MVFVCARPSSRTRRRPRRLTEHQSPAGPSLPRTPSFPATRTRKGSPSGKGGASTALECGARNRPPHRALRCGALRRAIHPEPSGPPCSIGSPPAEERGGRTRLRFARPPRKERPGLNSVSPVRRRPATARVGRYPPPYKRRTFRRTDSPGHKPNSHSRSYPNSFAKPGQYEVRTSPIPHPPTLFGRRRPASVPPANNPPACRLQPGLPPQSP